MYPLDGVWDTWRHLRDGHAWVNVSAQLVGIEGVEDAPLPLALKIANPERYGSLLHPGDSFSYDMFTQVSAAIRNTGEDSIWEASLPRYSLPGASPSPPLGY